MSELIRCDRLCKDYGAQPVLNQLDLSIESGRIVGLLGPNGTGKTTFIKLLCGLLRPSYGSVTIGGYAPGPETKAMVSYLPDRLYFADWMRAKDRIGSFADFYSDFSRERAEAMCASLGVAPGQKIKSMSKGTKEKLQLILAMSRRARLYLLDEPIAGVDPAAREFIMNTILANYPREATMIISTHLIEDVEEILDEAMFLQGGRVVMHDSVANIRAQGKTVDGLFREMFRIAPVYGTDLAERTGGRDAR